MKLPKIAETPAVCAAIACALFAASGVISAEEDVELLPAPAPDEIAYYVSDGDYIDMKISPSGEYLAARVRIGETISLEFLRSDDKSVIGGMKPEDGSLVFDYEWANDERVVFEIAHVRSGWEQPQSTGELYAIDSDGNGLKVLYGYRADDERFNSDIKYRQQTFASQDVLDTLPDDRGHVLIVEYPWVRWMQEYRDLRNTFPIISKLNVYSGAKRELETLRQRGANPVTDSSGAVRFMSWHDENAALHAAYRPHEQAPWQPVDGIVHPKGVPHMFGMTPGSQKLFAIEQAGPNLLDSVYRIDMENGEIAPLIEELESDVVHWIKEPDSGAPVGVISLPGEPRYDYIDPEHPLAKLHRGLRRAFGDQLVTIADSDVAGKRFVVRVESDTNPGEYYLYDTESKSADFVFANRSWMDLSVLPVTETHRVTARDGESVPVLLTWPQGHPGSAAKPDAKAGGKVPLVVLLHGGPHDNRADWRFDDEVQLLASRGYAVLRVNFRGSDGYGLRYQKLGYRQWGGQMIDDVLDATNWLMEAERERIGNACVYGTSFGAYAALMSVAHQPELFSCAIGYAGIYDLDLMFDIGDLRTGWGGEGYLRTVIGEDPAELEAYSPVHNAGRIEAPVLLLHGTQDTRVPIKHAAKMRKALERADNDVEFRALKTVGHGIYSVEHRVAFYERVLDFLGRHAPAG